MAPREYEAVNDLFNRAFHKKRGMRECMWKYKTNPAGEAICVVCEHEGKIVGYIAGMPREVQVGDKIIKSYLLGDLCIEEDYRGRGLFPMILFGYLKHITTLGIAILSKRMRDTWSKLAGERFKSSAIPKMTRSINIGLADIPSIISTHLFRRNGGDSHIIKTVTFGPEYDDLWDSVSPNMPTMVIRKSRYLNWRFVEKPDNDYEIYSWVEDGRVLGYIVLTARGSEGMIGDILTVRNTHVVEGLIQQAMKFFRAKNIKKIVVYAMDEYYRGIFKKHGFAETDSGMFFSTLNATDEVDKTDKSNPEKWFITAADSDAY